MSSANPLPVTGTITANLGATDNAVLDAIAASVSGTLTVGSHAVTNAGTFVVQINGDALTALQLIDDAVAAEGAALGKGVLIQGDDGTDRTNVLVDTDGHLQVDVLSSSTVTVTGTVTADLGAIDSATLSAIETAVEGTLTVGLPSGASTAAKQDTIIGHVDGIETLLGTIDTDTGTLAGTVSGSEIQVDIVASLPAGTNNIGDVDVLTFPSTVHSSDFDTGAGTDTTLSMGIAVPANGGAAVITGDASNGLDVDVTRVGGNVTVINSGTFAVQAAQSGVYNITNVTGTVSLPTGAATEAKQPALGTAGSAAADVITVQGVASMTPILVNGSGVTQPVSGTVTANLSATDNAVLDAIAASVAGTLTVGSHEVTNAGTFAVQVTGTALAAIQVIEDAVGEESSALNKGVLIQGDDGTDRTNVLVDTDGHLQVDIVTGGNVSTEYAVDDALGANPSGTLAIAIRDDALSALTPIEGDAVGVRVNANGALWVIPSGTTAISGTVTAELSATDNAVLDAIALSNAAIETAVEGTLTVSGTVDLGATDNAVLDAIAASTAAIETAVEGTLTVSGTVTANLSATDNAVLDAIAASVAGTLTVGSHHVTNAGTFAVQVNGDALTALQLLDNVVYVDDADWTATTSSHALVGGVYQSTPGTITDGDTGPIRLTANGAVHAAIQNTVTVASHAVTNAGTFAVQAAQSGTWTVDLGATDNAVLDAIAAATAAIETAVEGTLTVGSHAVTNAGTFAVQSTLQAGTAYAGKVRLTDGTTDTDIRDLANSNALNVAIVDDSGDQITSFGGGTQYAVDAALGANPTGTLAIAIRDDALSALTPADGDAVGLRTNSNGALWMALDGGTVNAAQSGTWNVGVTSSALPSGAATSAAQTTGNTALNAIQTAVEILDNAISGTEMQVDIVSSALPTGAATSANQSTANTALAAIQTAVQILDNAISGNEMQVDVVSSALPSGAATSANQSTMITSLQLLDDAISGSEMQVDVVAALPAGTNTIGVVINERVSTPSLTNVSAATSSTQLLASTAGRKAAYFWNDSTAIAYLKFGTSASSTSAVVALLPGAFFELAQPVYTGVITAIWTAANGAMRITELT